MFKERATKPERIDTGDYTPEEYATFLREIRFINQRLGDRAALEATLLADIVQRDQKEFSVLDVGAGTGELLGVIADFAAAQGRSVQLVGLDINELSVKEIVAEAARHPKIAPVMGDAMNLPFADKSFEYTICSLFTHHLANENIPRVLTEMSRVTRSGIVVIDLERSITAWFLYQIFCLVYRISPLVRQDGSLSIRKGFTSEELVQFGQETGLTRLFVERHPPYRVVMTTFER
ncbi:MAG TPA: methyltransferase domain-containing protein [Pyrinomonadaceae bacterium]|nr:methyltransferase domain-containing protein [Pyrinomonadaceae bacterium]